MLTALHVCVRPRCLVRCDWLVHCFAVCGHVVSLLSDLHLCSLPQPHVSPINCKRQPVDLPRASNESDQNVGGGSHWLRFLLVSCSGDQSDRHVQRGTFASSPGLHFFVVCVYMSSAINPLSPGVKLQVFFFVFHTFLTEVVGRSCQNINRI